MPRPHATTSRIFSHRSRAIVLEAEWKIDMARVATELKPLIKLAVEQGWSVDGNSDGTKLVWRGPNGEGPIYTGYRVQGRNLANWRGELSRAGLRLDEAQQADQQQEEKYEQIVEAGKTITTVDELRAHLDAVMGFVSTVLVKVDSYDEMHSIAQDNQEECLKLMEQNETLTRALKEREELIGAIATCFGMAPWAILPEIAKLLGIDASSPLMQPSLANAVTSTRLDGNK